ncbi:MAG: DUF2975 domain-containing protein [Saccharofermentans sp.]|nr:DUF2975 domain-containing protein [Saccharofermentans sp.]
MKYNDVVIRWSKIATILFAAMVVAADVFGVVISKYMCYIWADKIDDVSLTILTVVFYLGTIFAYGILASLFVLLNNMSKDKVFDKINTKLMDYIVLALVGIAVVCTVGGFVWFGSWFLAIISLFMGLVVLSVRVCFVKAITMKEEMDLTI